jgi:C-terminal processing protease CtpA/Prc
MPLPRLAHARTLALALAALALVACGPKRGTIGAVLAQARSGRLFVRDVPPGLGAARAGLRPDDEILLINGRDVRSMSDEQVHQALSGTVGEKVNLTVVRGERVLHVTVHRTPVPEFPPAPAK